MTRRLSVLCIAALLGCKSRGTIAVAFDLDGTGSGSGSCAAFADVAQYVLYAQPLMPCSTCACGGCAGSGATLECPALGEPGPCTTAELVSRDLDLSPGPWAVVLEAYSAASPGSAAALIASQCIDIVVDADGQASEALSVMPTNCAACTH